MSTTAAPVSAWAQAPKPADQHPARGAPGVAPSLLPGMRPQGAWARPAASAAHQPVSPRAGAPRAAQPLPEASTSTVQRGNFARAGCRPAPPPRAAVLDSAGSGTHDRRLDPDSEAFGRTLSLSDSAPSAPPGLDTPQRSLQGQEDANGWITRHGQQRQAAAAPLPTTVARTIDGRELTREPQVLAELHAQDEVKHLFDDYKPNVRDPSNTMIAIATREFDETRMKRACKLMDSGMGVQRAAKEAGVYKSQLKAFYEEKWGADSDDDDDDDSDEDSDDEDYK